MRSPDSIPAPLREHQERLENKAQQAARFLNEIFSPETETEVIAMAINRMDESARENMFARLQSRFNERELHRD